MSGSALLQASFGLEAVTWNSINWTACHRKVRSLQRRIVQAVQAGAWRKVKRLSYLLVNSFSAQALAVKRVTENRGRKTPGVDGEIWDTPALKAQAVQRLADVQGYQPRPLKRKYIAKRNGKRRPLSIPVMEDRGRQAVHLQALSPIAETRADHHSYGFRVKRRCADAIGQCINILCQRTSASWILEGDIKGFFDYLSFPWIEQNIPMDKRILSKWLRSGYMEDETYHPTTQGVPQGGLVSPVIGNLALDGMEQLVKGKSVRFRQRHIINFVRYADDFIVTANNREVLEALTLELEAFLAVRGVSLSKEKTKITPINEGFDFLGQTLRKYPRPNGKPAKLQITPSKASFQSIKEKIRAICKSHKGATPNTLINKLNPVLRGWANYHRHIICAETFAKVDHFVWGRVYRWCKRRHPDKTGRWIANRYFLSDDWSGWRFTDPATGNRLINIAEAVKRQRYVKIKAAANPFDPQWDAYFQNRGLKQSRSITTRFKARIYAVQDGVCPACQQMITDEEDLILHHRDGQRNNNALANLVFYHPNCYFQVYSEPDSKIEWSRL
jgi:RNA-directed DNA polymerase